VLFGAPFLLRTHIFVGMGGITLISIPFLSYAGTTLNGAEAIMVNMSEGWIQSIIG
jgi:hypothetical protein